MENNQSRWDADTIRWYDNAAAYDNCYGTIAGMILPALRSMPRVCDIGCGIGSLALALAPGCEFITAIDINPYPLSYLNNNKPANVMPVCGDFKVLAAPEEKYDAVVSCLYGTPTELYEIASNGRTGCFS